MADSFDPYLQWLGIRDPQRPPNHYRLLGVDLYESDPEVLCNAADRQMAHVRTFQTGRHSKESQGLLNQLAAAKLCLLNHRKKTAYDARLLAEQEEAGRREEPGQDPPAGSVESSGPPPVSLPVDAPVKTGSRVVSVAIAMLGGMVLALGGLIVWATLGGMTAERPRAIRSAGEKQGGPPVEPVLRPDRPQPDTPQPDVPNPEIPQPDVPQPRGPLVDATEPDTPEPDAPRPDEPGTDETQPDATGTDTPGPQVPEPPEDQRIAVPEKTAQREMVREIRNLLQDHYARAKDPTGKRVLARMLYQKAVETRDDPVARYVLFSQAGDQAIEAGEAALFLQALKSIGKEYAVDWLVMAAATLRREAGRTRDEKANQTMAGTALQLVREAVAKDEYDMAAILAEAARDMARKARHDATVKQAVAMMRDVEARTQLHEAFLQAGKTLAEQPDDPVANLTAGKYYCFAKDDFPRGLPMLLKGNDLLLHGLAEAEMGLAKERSEWVALGDRWYDNADSAGQAIREFLRNRAAYWYRKALPELTGLTRTKIERRLEELSGQ